MRQILFVAALVYGLCWTTPLCAQPKGKVPPLDLKGKTVPQVFTELLPGMGAKDIAARHAPQQQWQSVCYQAGAPGNDALRLEVCKLMLAKLGTETPGPARLWLLKQLEFLGRAEAVDAVAAALADKDDLIHDAALRCLANNPAPEATTKLLASLTDSSGKRRVGVLNALGYRQDTAAVAALAKELANSEQAAAIAAARALGKIASADAAKALGEARGKAKEQTRLWIGDAYLLCADRFLREGKTDEAYRIYEELNQATEARSLRLAALRGVLRTSGDRAAYLILKTIATGDADARAIAIAQIESISPGALKSLGDTIDKLPGEGQILVIDAIAARGDKAQQAVALKAASSSEDRLRKAGIRALGRLGDASSVPQLLETLHKDAKLGGIARQSLIDLVADGVNEKIIAALKAERATQRQVALIAILEARRAAAAVPVLLEAARSEDAALRSSATTALRQLADVPHIPALVAMLHKSGKGKERAEAEATILTVCGKIAELEKRAEPVLAVYATAETAEKLVLLPLLGRLGGVKSLAEVKAALASDKAELREAGVLALCGWPDPTVSDELLKLIADAKDAERRTLALHSLIRVNAVVGEHPTAARLVMLKKAMELSPQIEEQRLVLAALATVKDIGALRFVEPYLDHKQLVQPACKTIVELAHSKMLREPNKMEFDRALDRVIALCRDKGLVERAKKYKQGF